MNTETMTRREFLAGAAALAIAAAVPEPTPALPPPPAADETRHRSGDIRVGVLHEPLPKGGSAQVFCPNPYHPVCGSWYVVHAGPLVHDSWPTGHPVAFASVGGRFETVGW